MVTKRLVQKAKTNADIELVQVYTSEDVFREIPLGLLSLATYIKQLGYQSEILDLGIIFENKKFSSRFFINAAKKILSSNPKSIGFNVMCNSLPGVLLIARECKKIAPEIPIILGGPEVSFDEIEVMKTFEQVDIIVRGEGEITLVEVLEVMRGKRLLENVQGITYRKEGKVIRNPDRLFIENLNELPFLDFSLIPHLEKYNALQIEAGRGCPFRCTFCSTCRMWKRNFRMKSPQRLIEEMQKALDYIKDNGWFDFHIVHDHFLASKKFAGEFLSGLKNKGIRWRCSSRLEALDEELIIKLKEAGCKRILIGIESGSKEVQEKIKKRLPLAKLKNVLEMLFQNDIFPFLTFIIGFPFENKSQMDETLKTALMSRIYCPSSLVHISLFVYLKGSEIYCKNKEKFNNAEFLQTNVSSLVTSLPEEKTLVQKYPDIFPSFYRPIKKGKSYEFLEKICELYVFLIEAFPLTTILLCGYAGCSPLDFGKEIISLMDQDGFIHKQVSEEKKWFELYFPFLKKFVAQNSNSVIKEVFLHEKLFQESSFSAANSSASKKAIRLASRPKIPDNVIIQIFNYDIFSLMEKLKSGKKNKINKSKSYIAYIPGQIAKALPLLSSSYDLLLLCDGERTMKDIIQLSFDNINVANSNRKLIIDRFAYLKDKGIITV
ncbi:MAG: B12-binding domain-containing radical SAM protein [Candidatus Margulisbacteria bacterium]|nr:B12-binding domain-containing radical SAM protein [Candidatus Margulisiibacteriota bacterium]MBU1022244.1 B12-binding domain-containing radical SAM protein [Candidatus Margulisiibacteriota bacterium]MBU1729317.1 B12-binding domain-containing radical SAM protein [Candidatus Margulisiibacteriota bacterium]MBU1955590.1 B12-binding domain-containing radical SAM protein [Candidatus Margulisiibacteriota bacterium]